MSKKDVGDNIKAEVKGPKLTLEIDLTKDFGPSKSGKTITIATTRGNQKMYDAKNKPFVVGINCYKYPEEK